MKSSRLALASSLLALIAAPVALDAKPVPHPLFSDHAVLQEGMPLTVWGTADDGEQVSVEVAGVRGQTVARQGHWMLVLPMLPAGGPYTMHIRGSEEVVINDLLVGEVWLCSGQSNMERQLGPRQGQKPIIGWEKAAAEADYPQLRHFGVAQRRGFGPQTNVEGKWVVSTPQTAADFTAVGFYFGRALQRARKVPVGLIHSSWGGTPAESWMSMEALLRQPNYVSAVKEMRAIAKDPSGAGERYERSLAEWFKVHDTGTRDASPWSAEKVSAEGWTTSVLPGFWEANGLPAFDGLVWYRKEFELPAASVGAAELSLGPVDDSDTTWINGVKIGSTDGFNVPRKYQVPAGLLHAGKNVVAVRVLDTGGGGGLWGEAAQLSLTPAAGAAIPLAGEWQRRVACSMATAGYPPVDLRQSPSAPSCLYNAMIAPLQPYGIRGTIWYQGESNDGRAKEYQTLFPALIADWRAKWGLGDFPFLFVQVAPFKDMSPEIREAQLVSLKKTQKTAMVVTIDCGDAEDIHPANKEPVGERLALAARALAYGERIEYSGPLYSVSEVREGKVLLSFTHVDSGLVAKDGPLFGFEVAGADKVFHPAKAEIKGRQIELSSPEVPAPVQARYAWAKVASGNLFNGAGLPASPFRTNPE
jgi:sialate O-acetylesterase